MSEVQLTSTTLELWEVLRYTSWIAYEVRYRYNCSWSFDKAYFSMYKLSNKIFYNIDHGLSDISVMIR